MRPKPARTLPGEGDWTFEPWRNGERVLAYTTGETAVLMNERGRDVTRRHRSIADELVSLAGRVGRPFVLDGEIAATGTASGGARKQSGSESTFHASDLLLDGDDVLLDEPWSVRRSSLEALFRRRRLNAVALQQIDTSASTALRRAARGSWPGVIARRADAPYEPGTRSDALLRIAIR